MDQDTRRQLFERVRSKAELAGTPIESDPLFLTWVEEWIQGEIDLSDLTMRYGQLLALKRIERAHKRNLDL